jgi:hypothetical protein
MWLIVFVNFSIVLTVVSSIQPPCHFFVPYLKTNHSILQSAKNVEGAVGMFELALVRNIFFSKIGQKMVLQVREEDGVMQGALTEGEGSVQLTSSLE